MPPPTLEAPAVGCVGLRPEAAPPLGCGELWPPGAAGARSCLPHGHLTTLPAAVSGMDRTLEQAGHLIFWLYRLTESRAQKRKLKATEKISGPLGDKWLACPLLLEFSHDRVLRNLRVLPVSEWTDIPVLPCLGSG